MEINEKDLEWSPKYNLGVSEIDLQHQYFLSLINRICGSLNDNKYRDYHSSFISELNYYARFHFISEENLMAIAGYPELEDHKQKHRDLIQELYVKQFWIDGSQTAEVNEYLRSFLVSWFFDHTLTVDRRFANFLLVAESSKQDR